MNIQGKIMDAKDPSTTASTTQTASEERQGWLTRRLAGFYTSRDTIKKHPLWGTLFFLACVLSGVAAHETYQYIRGKIVGPDQFLVQMRDEQKQEFAQLQEDLGKLSGSLDKQGRQAFDSVRGAVKSLESTNSSLMDQLVMAKRENDSLRKIAQEKTGLSGGYDFILSSNGGIRIDPSTVLGLRYVTGNSVALSLTSSGKEESPNLHSGQSIAYTNATGKNCKVSVLSLNYEAKSASFAVGCTAS
ncbi:MAG: hypothetical protein ABI128_05445 [Rhodanobacter sp.]